MNARSRGALRTILLYAHDTCGLGHLPRNLAIADHLLRAHPGQQAVLMSGSPVAERFTLLAELSLVHLPSVAKVGRSATSRVTSAWTCAWYGGPGRRSWPPSPVVGTAGGGGDGAEMLVAALTACRTLSLPSLVVTGPLMAPPERRALEAQAATDPRARALEFVSDLGATITGASAVVTM